MTEVLALTESEVAPPPPDTQPETPPPPQPTVIRHSTLREYYVTTVVCTILALFVTTYVVHPMTVPTPSMVPTILVGDRLLIDKFTIRNGFAAGVAGTPSRSIRRGDVIVFKYPINPEVLYVKRVIGLPGETLEITNKTVRINGRPLEESYKYHQDSYTYERPESGHFYAGDSKRDNFGPIQIPDGRYFMMGDNRDDSADSRYWGTLDQNLIVGRPLFIFWSYQDDSDSYLKTGPLEVVQLYASRAVNFFTKTRWERTGQLIR